jgi:hypothetical protein
MDRCYRCGRETELYDNGVPVCTECAEEAEGGRKPASSETPGESRSRTARPA